MVTSTIIRMIIPLRTHFTGIIEAVLMLAFVVPGLVILYRGFDRWRLAELVRNTGTETIQSAAVGRTEIEGIAKPTDTVIEQPFTDGQCLYVKYAIKERIDYGEGRGLKVLDEGFKTINFEVTDGNDSILVDPTSADEVDSTGRVLPPLRFLSDVVQMQISGRNSTTIKVEEGESPPEQVKAFLETTDVSLTSKHRREYEQEVIPVGESVYVLGEAKLSEDEDRLVLRGDTTSGRFIISDMSGSVLARTLKFGSRTSILAGLVLIAIGSSLLFR